MKLLKLAIYVVAITSCLLQPSTAQTVYPAKAVKLVVPFSPGGSTDLFARSVAERLGAMWGQPVIIENRGGAAGNIGTDYVAKSANDGYTLVMGTVSTHAVAQSLYPRLPYKVQRDFAPITELATIAQVLSVNPSLPVHSVADLVAYAKARPEQVAYNGSVGTTPHMSMELFASRAGVRMLPVAYKGSAPAMIDLVSGQLQTAFDVIMTSMPYVKAGKLRAIAVSSAKRSPLLPQVPTVAESGYAGFESDVWFGLFAPAGTPPAIVRKIASDTRTVLNEPELRQKLETAGFAIVASSPEEFAKRVDSDIKKWQKLIADAKITAE